MISCTQLVKRSPIREKIYTMFKKVLKINKKNITDKGMDAFMEGEVISLNSVNDDLFSNKVLGDGFAIKPQINRVVAPIAGEVSIVFPTGHAYGIISNGVEVLLHLGLETVEYEGKGFTSHVKVGDLVSKGQLLAEMDLDFFIEEKIDITSMLVLTSGQSVKIEKENSFVTLGQSDVATIEAN